MKKLRTKPEDKLLSRRYRDRVLRLANEYLEKEVRRRQQDSNTIRAFTLMLSFLLGMGFMGMLVKVAT